MYSQCREMYKVTNPVQMPLISADLPIHCHFGVNFGGNGNLEKDALDVSIFALYIDAICNKPHLYPLAGAGFSGYCKCDMQQNLLTTALPRDSRFK